MQGRDQEVKIMKQILDHSLDTPTWIHLSGNSGTGKSELIQLTSENVPFVFRFDCKLWIDSKYFFTRLADTYFPSCKKLSLISLKGAIAQYLIKEQKRRCNLYLILDHLDWMPADEINSFLLPLLKLAHLPIGLNGTSRICIVTVSNKQSIGLPFSKLDLYFCEYERPLIDQIVLEKLENLELPYLKNLVSVVIDYCYHVYSDLNELISLTRSMAEYCIKSEIELEESTSSAKFSSLNHRLYKTILPQLKRTFDQFYCTTTFKAEKLVSNPKTLEYFPILSKQLLICAFLASHRNEKYDISLFASGKTASKRKKRKQSSELDNAASGRSISLRPFAVERMLALFRNIFGEDYSSLGIIDEIVLFGQVAQLNVSGLLSSTTTSRACPLTGMKMRCNLTGEDARSLARQLKFDIVKYL